MRAILFERILLSWAGSVSFSSSRYFGSKSGEIVESNSIHYSFAAFTARTALMSPIPVFESFPFSPRSWQLFSRIDFTFQHGISGLADKTNAATPAIWGLLKEFPFIFRFGSRYAFFPEAKIGYPGPGKADRSGFISPFGRGKSL